MTRSKGFAPLKEPNDLLQKLGHDLDRMKRDPSDSYSAFDFFVTTEHMLDWIHPGYDKKTKKIRKSFREANDILQLVSDIANGAKHFDDLLPHHSSVENLEYNSGGFDPQAFDTEASNPGSFFSGITVTLTNGEKRHALDIAIEAHQFWVEFLRDT